MPISEEKNRQSGDAGIIEQSLDLFLSLDIKFGKGIWKTDENWSLKSVKPGNSNANNLW